LDDHPEPAYHLVNITDYLHSYFSEKRVMELESSRGCPFACGFCYNALYNKRSWRPLSPERVVERIKKLQTDYQVEVFHFIDDAFFVDKRRAIKILQMICDENLQIRIGFQGIRVDTFVRMGEDFIPLMDKAGVRFLQFGVESGSPRILKLINKKIKVEDVVHINRLLSNYPRIIPYYNFMCGFPTEDREDVYKSTALAWNLLRDNKQALISPFHHYRPYPGTALADTAIKGCYKVPDSLEGWGTFDWTNSSTKDLDAKMYRLFKKIEMTSILADDKLKIQSDSAFWSIATKLYQPLARFRLKNNFYSLMPESVIMRK
jgi:radical SAM superfamily enzyme YgiQ (UPF0313 family)